MIKSRICVPRFREAKDTALCRSYQKYPTQLLLGKGDALVFDSLPVLFSQIWCH